MDIRFLDLYNKRGGMLIMLIRTALDVQKEVGLNLVPGKKGGVMVPGTRLGYMGINKSLMLCHKSTWIG